MNKSDIEYQLAAHKRDQLLGNVVTGIAVLAIVTLCIVYLVAA